MGDGGDGREGIRTFVPASILRVGISFAMYNGLKLTLANYAFIEKLHRLIIFFAEPLLMHHDILRADKTRINK